MRIVTSAWTRVVMASGIAACLVAFAGAAPPRDALPTQAEIRTLIRQRVEAGQATGIVVGVLDAAGKTRTVAFGDAGRGALPLSAESVFEIGSVTKVFTGTLLAEMTDRGEVKPDDPVSKYLPRNVKVPSRNGRRITLIDLSTHSSGLPRLMTNFSPTNAANPYADYTVKQLDDFLGSYQLTRDIGAQYEYSNVGTGLLGHALALGASMSYEALVTERILHPLDMTRTAITLTPWMQAHLAHGHNNQGEPVPNWDVPTLAGAGALRSTAKDMLKFVAANLNPAPGRLFRAMRETHVVRRPAGAENMSIGMNWHIRQVGARKIIWHNGGTGGYRSFVGFDPEARIGVVVLMNSTQGADDIGFHMVNRSVPLAAPPRR